MVKKKQDKECQGAGVCGKHEVPEPVENALGQKFLLRN